MKKIIIGAASALAITGIAYMIKRTRQRQEETSEEKTPSMKAHAHLTDAFSKAKKHTVARAAG